MSTNQVCLGLELQVPPGAQVGGFLLRGWPPEAHTWASSWHSVRAIISS